MDRWVVVVRSVANQCVGMVRWFGSSVGSIVITPRCSINIMYIYISVIRQLVDDHTLKND
jgi:hypothetical protein